MKFHISRQMTYILALAIIFLIVVFIFAFVFLIPSGKEYRIARMESKKVSYQVDTIQAEYDKVYERLKGLQAENRHIIGAYKNIFNPDRFKKMHASYFESFSLSEISKKGTKDEFTTFEVNTSSLIHSPQGFYDFLDAVNKSDNIIGVNFPIHFERDANLIKSSFTMHTYIARQKSSEEDEGKGTAK